MWDAIKYSNIHVMGVPEGEDREKEQKNTQWDNDWKLPKSDEKH